MGRTRHHGRTTPADVALLVHVAADDVTWQSDMGGRRSYRLWSTEHDYTICTPRAVRLLGRGLIKAWTGYVHGRGGIELTPAGRDLLAVVTGSQDGAS